MFVNSVMERVVVLETFWMFLSNKFKENIHEVFKIYLNLSKKILEDFEAILFNFAKFQKTSLFDFLSFQEIFRRFKI